MPPCQPWAGGLGTCVSPGPVDRQTADLSRSSAPPDTVKFGEVALQPPELTAKPKTSVSRGQVSRGGAWAGRVPGVCPASMQPLDPLGLCCLAAS